MEILSNVVRQEFNINSGKGHKIIFIIIASDVIFLENPRDRKTSQNNNLGTVLKIN